MFFFLMLLWCSWLDMINLVSPWHTAYLCLRATESALEPAE